MIQLTDRQYEDQIKALEGVLLDLHRSQNNITRLILRNNQTTKSRSLRRRYRQQSDHHDQMIRDISDMILSLRWAALGKEE